MLNLIREKLKPVYLFIYRFIAFFAITGSLLFLIGWAWIMVFFMGSSTWIAPTRLSMTNDKMLTFNQAYQTADQNLETLTVTRDQAARELQTVQSTYSRLTDLSIHFNVYLDSLKKTAPVKLSQVGNSMNLFGDLNAIEVQARRNAKLGLISNDILVSTLSTIAQFKSIATDGKTNWETTNITAQGNLITLSTQLDQARNDIATKKATMDAAANSLVIAQKVMDNLGRSVYKYTFDGNGSNLVFLPNSGLDKVKVGSPIYDCYLTVIICHQVGTISHIFDDEQTVEFPLFNIKLSHTERGVIGQANMTVSKSMRSSILFVGRKPLFF
jgi:hypothetical protein